MKCPKCNVDLQCPCPSCRSREPPGLHESDHYKWRADGEIIECPNCGFAAHADFWLDEKEKEKTGV
jgi:hypothetical protein